MNEQIVKGKWNEMKGELMRTWGKITGDEMDANSGNLTAIAGLVQQRYGLAKEEAMKKVGEIAARYGQKTDGALDKVKEKISTSVENAKANIRQ